MFSTFEDYLQQKNPLISWNGAEKKAKGLKKVYEEVSLLTT